MSHDLHREELVTGNLLNHAILLCRATILLNVCEVCAYLWLNHNQLNISILFIRPSLSPLASIPFLASDGRPTCSILHMCTSKQPTFSEPTSEAGEECKWVCLC